MSALTPVTWKLGIPPIHPNHIYLYQGGNWEIPAVMRWKYNSNQAKWYFYFLEQKLDDDLGPFSITDLVADTSTFFLLYTYDESHDDYIDPTSIPAKTL